MSPNRRKLLWTVPPEVQLEWRTWDGTSVVFNPASGATHLLDAVAAEVLRRLETQPTSIEGLCEEMLELFKLSSAADQDPRRQLEILVTQFDELGLITPTRP